VSGKDDRFDFRLLKQRVSIEQILTAYGLAVSLRATGDQLCGPCPLHGGDNPTAFRVQLRRGIWHCFTGCGGGDVVELVRRLERCDYAAAARHLARLARLEPPVLSAPHPSRRQDHTADAFRPFRQRIPLNPHVAFLQQRKGIAVATAVRFEAGCAERSGFLRNTVAVRLYDLHGRPLGYCGRRLKPVDVARWGKWRFPTAFPKSESLYNAHRAAAARAGGIVVVECPWAVMRLAQAGIAGAVALLGTALSDAQSAWLAAAPRVMLLLDGDEAGRKASAVIAKRLGRVAVVYTLDNNREPEDLSDHALTALVRAYLPFSLNQYSC
jgi:DNA primase